MTINHGRHEIKAGVESDNIFLNENFSYIITDPTQFDPALRSPSASEPTARISSNRRTCKI